MSARQQNYFRLGLVILVIFAGITYKVFSSSTLGDLSGDSARYVLLAHALASGQGFSEIEKPGAPAHTEYGPGLPVCLVPVVSSDDHNFTGMKSIIWAFALLSMPLTFMLFHKQGEGLALAVASVSALAPLMVQSANLIMADVPYLTTSLIALILIDRALERQGALLWLLAGLAAALAFFFRQVGLALFVAGLLALIFQVRPKSNKASLRYGLGFSFGFLVPVCAWLVRNVIQSGSPDQMHVSKLFAARASDPLAGQIGIIGLLERTLSGFKFYALEIARQWSLLDWAVPTICLALLVVALIGLGWLVKLRSKRGAIEFYLPLYLIIISAWQIHFTRYLLPVFPLLYYYAFCGALKVGGRFKMGSSDVRLAIAAWLALIVLALNVVGLMQMTTATTLAPRSPQNESLDHESSGLAGQVNWGDYVQIHDWMKNPERAQNQARSYYHFLAMGAWMERNLSADSLTVCRKPRLLALYSRTLVVQFPPKPEPRELLAALEEMDVEYVMFDEVSPGVRMILDKTRAAYPKRLRMVKALGNTKLMKLQ